MSENGSTRRVTQRDIAKALKVTHVTVSLALRESPKISKGMRTKVKAMAEKMGYMPDPMLSALSFYRETSKEKPVQTVLAWINPWKEPHKLRELQEFDLYWQGASRTAQQLGYRLEEFRLAEISPQRLDCILKTRRIRGLILAPFYNPELDWGSFPWEDYAIIRFGCFVPFPATHMVTSAQMTNSMRAFDQIHKKGYQRIGCVCEFIRSRVLGLGLYWAQRDLPRDQQLPLLLLNKNDPYAMQQQKLSEWISKAKPDAIFTDLSGLPSMLEDLGYRIPEDLGLATSTIHDTPINAGIDQIPQEIGCSAIRSLVGLMVSNHYGIPEVRNEILVEGRWQDGAMLPDRT